MIKAISAVVLFLAMTVALAGCSELQFGAALGKKIYHETQPQTVGKFKVGRPYSVGGVRYYPEESYTLEETGIASWYGPGFHGKQTASGEKFNQYELTAAHRTLQLPSLVRVTNLENGRSLIVRVNDRGPFKRGRIIDLSKKAAELIGMMGRGTARVRLQVLSEESRIIAQAAKSGKDTRGVELALNQGQGLPPALQRTALAATEQPVPGHMTQGVFYPDAVVTQLPVTPSALYIQTGAFSVQANAQAQAQRLLGMGFPATITNAFVGQEQMFRVRVGPYQQVPEADTVLGRIAGNGFPQAMTVVDDPH